MMSSTITELRRQLGDAIYEHDATMQALQKYIISPQAIRRAQSIIKRTELEIERLLKDIKKELEKQ